MNNCPVAFVAFEEFDNLGVGYMAAVLHENGYETEILDFRDRKEEILKNLQEINPLIVGFSVIFQYHINEFAELVRYLRNGGINCHFTSGGQYPSLKYEDLFRIIPEFDSIVRFDGEYTFLELVKCISERKDWKTIRGIAYKQNERISVNPNRVVETELDRFPFPLRSPLKIYALGKKFATILSGRGCVNNCVYCYLRDYARQSAGPLKRIRKPENVVREMELLNHHKDCAVFMFEDDDFPVKTSAGSEWIEKFCKELRRKNLVDKILWKINCRPDEIDLENFEMMKNHGLSLVFLGIEDGTDIGLKQLNKHMTIKRCLEGINILKKIEIDFNYGFMLFQPTSTYVSVKENLKFLRDMCADGFTSVSFLKMMPYSGTQIEVELRNEGRLIGKPEFLDYSFLDVSMDNYYEFISDCFSEWLRADEGVLNISKWARNYIAVFSKFYGRIPEIQKLSDEIKKVTAESNLFIIDTMNELAALFESGENKKGSLKGLNSFRKLINAKQVLFKRKFNNIIIEILAHYECQKYFRTTVYR